MNTEAQNTSILVQAGFLPDTAEYGTFIRHFPGINAHAPWGTHGTFRFEVKIYEAGNLIATASSGTVDEQGHLHMDLGAVAESCGHPVTGMFVVEYHHTKDIPIELYAFHVHKATGTYVSCNITSFIGDKLYPTIHTDQMENTVFWPGLITGTDNEAFILVLNPYDVNMGVQAHLIGGPDARVGTGIMQIKPKQAREFAITALFPPETEMAGTAGGRVSLCISSQYKLIAYVMFKSRVHNVLSMLDHLHNFCLA